MRNTNFFVSGPGRECGITKTQHIQKEKILNYMKCFNLK